MKMKTRERETRWILEEKYGGRETSAFLCDLTRLARGEPVDYIIGFTEFLGCRIDLSRHPFIPRPETEHWVAQAIVELEEFGERPLRCLDVFAGSGCIGIALLKRLANATVDFIEREERFLEQIRINAERNGVRPVRYRLLCSDVFAGASGTYDAIFANPPYVAESRISEVQSSVLVWEPRGAIFGGQDGLRDVRRAIEGARAHLRPGGRLYIEFDDWQRDLVEAIAARAGFASRECRKDHYGAWRWALLTEEKRSRDSDSARWIW